MSSLQYRLTDGEQVLPLLGAVQTTSSTGGYDYVF